MDEFVEPVTLTELLRRLVENRMTAGSGTIMMLT